MSSTAAPERNLRSFTYSKTFLVGFGFLGISIIWPIFNQFIPIFLQAGNPVFEQQLLEAGRELPQVRGFGLAPSLALFIMTWDNIINVFLQPWIGARSDQTWTRLGRRKPWILLGVPIAFVGFILIPFAQTALALAAFILITNVGMAIFRSPTVAWLGDLFEPVDRSKANGVINLMGGVGGVLAFVGGGLLFDNMGREAPFIGGGILMLVAAGVVLWRVREPRQIEKEDDGEETAVPGLRASLQFLLNQKARGGIWLLLAIFLWFVGFNALEAGLSSFAVFTLGMAPGTASIYAASITIAFILFALPAGYIGTAWGRKPTIGLGLIGLTLLFGAAYFIIQSPITFILVLALAGLFWALVNVNSLPFVFDFSDPTQIGAATGLYYFSSQAAAIVGPTLGGITVELLGNQYRWLFLFSTLFMALAWLAVTRIRTPA
jgi:maltose/moltooligosaccharide transporter